MKKNQEGERKLRPMTDYHPLIGRVREGRESSAGETRRALYERARTALVTRLRAVDSPLSESEITKIRLALEDAIREVEAEAARKPRTEPREQRSAAAPLPRGEYAFAHSGRGGARRAEPTPPIGAEPSDAANLRTTAPLSARERLANARRKTLLKREGVKGFRDVVSEVHSLGGASAKAAQSARDTPQPRLVRSYRGLVKLLAALIILGGLLATISWQWPHVTGIYHTISRIGVRQPAQANQENALPPKFSGRVPQGQSAAQTPATAPGSQAVSAVAQRVVLYEEGTNDPEGKRYVGSAIWRTEAVSRGADQAPKLAVRADVEIPERHMTMTWLLCADPAVPPTHAIGIIFNLPADFPGGGIAKVPGILMNQSEQARGTPLAGIVVTVTNGFFLIGLSAADADKQRNIELLKEQPWFDIPIVYANGGRALLAMEKGAPGDRAFADAFAAWQNK
jgi:hypothetical protein